MRRAIKEKKLERRVMECISEMFSAGSLVVVEGAHDVRALKDLKEDGLHLGEAKIKTYSIFMNDGIGKQKYERIYLFMDDDEGGEEKTLKALSFASEKEPGMSVDTETGKKLMKMLGTKRAEEIREPLDRIRRD